MSERRVPQKYIVQSSGGVTSWAAASRLAERHGPDQVLMLSANTNSEAPDWLSFVEACRADVGCELVMLDNDGQDIWGVFRKNRFLGNSRVDLCSRILKREPLRAWLDENCDPSFHVVAIGFDWDEPQRIAKAAARWEPWTVIAPMAEEPYVYKQDLFDLLGKKGISLPEAYAQGFSHNNCNRTCVKAGQAHWAKLLQIRPDIYREAEQQERALRAELGNVAILTDRRDLGDGEKRRPLPLDEFRRRLGVNDEDFDAGDWGACSCMDGGDDEEGAG